jgi:hypothetical protein
MQNKKISEDLGRETKKAIIKMGATNYGMVDTLIVFDSKKGVNLKYTLNKIKNNLDFFSEELYEELRLWHEKYGTFSICKIKYTYGLMQDA